MMEYLKDYNINEEQIKNIIDVLEENEINVDIFMYDPKKIISILELFKDYGITNYYEIITTSPTIFCDTIKSIEERLNKYENKNELARLINENASNLSLVGLI